MNRPPFLFLLAFFFVWMDLLSAVNSPFGNPKIRACRRGLEAESATAIGETSRIAVRDASEGFLVQLKKPNDGILFRNLPAAKKLAIRYASVNVGTITVEVDGQPAHKVNIHSSGALTGSYLYSIIDLQIAKNASICIRLMDDDVPVNLDKILVGNGNLGLPPDGWNLPPLPVAKGVFPADWKGLSQLYTVPDWWREAKFGAWSHWDPQSMPEQGDWYARGMYVQGNKQYDFNLRNFGHPSEYGYKDICNNWIIDKWDPEALMNLYVEMGARYFVAMGVHHDNFDCWNSTYQPWNAVRIGPKKDIVGIWEKVARQHAMRFGIGFHNTPGRTWGQFMTVRYTSDKTGPLRNVPYDALQTIQDGKGTWWEGMDPVDLYGPVHDKKEPLSSPFANQFMWRVDDAISKYHPDLIYFDDHAGDSQVDLGVHMGLGFLAPSLIANYYNKSMQWNHGKMDVVINLKAVGGRYNSFQNSPQLLPLADRSLVKSTEADIEPEITAYPFQTETSIAEWHYQIGQHYQTARTLVGLLMKNVARNGTMLLNITQHGRGDLDPEVIRICKDIGSWLKVNGEAVYGSRPFEVFGDNSVLYTRNNGQVYATLLDWTGTPVTLSALHLGGATIGDVTKVELLGSDLPVSFVQDVNGLTIKLEGQRPTISGIDDKSLAASCRVLRITHTKSWINDDDPGVKAPGWIRQCNLGTGDYNNDLTTSLTLGDVWSCSFSGNGVAVIAPKGPGAGKIEIRIDGKTRTMADLSNMESRMAQQTVSEISGLSSGKHTIQIIHNGNGPVSVDAIVESH